MLHGLVHMPQKFKKKKKMSQKRAVRFVFNEDRLNHSRPRLRKINALNVYQFNLLLGA